MAAPSPAATLKNGTGYAFGFAQKEVGINADSMTVNVEPEYIEQLKNEQNCTIVKAYGPMKLNVTISGEINATTGIMAMLLASTYTFANSVAYFGAPTTGLYFEGGEIAYARGAFLKLNNAKFEALAGIP